MMTPKSFMLLATFAVIEISVGLVPFARAQTAANLPPEVVELVSRRSGCLDLNRKAFEQRAQLNSIMDAMRSLRCGEITDDEKALREKYSGNPEILEALKATWVKVVKRLPVQIHVPASPNP